MQIKIPTIGHVYVVCLKEHTKEITHLIEINRFEADDIIKRLTNSSIKK